MISGLFSNGPSAEAQAAQKVTKFGEKSTCSMESRRRQVNILMAAAHGTAAGDESKGNDEMQSQLRAVGAVGAVITNPVPSGAVPGGAPKPGRL